MTHSIDESVGSSFLERVSVLDGEAVDYIDRSPVSEIVHRYRYRGHHNHWGFIRKAVVSVTLLMGALWLAPSS